MNKFKQLVVAGLVLLGGANAAHASYACSTGGTCASTLATCVGQNCMGSNGTVGQCQAAIKVKKAGAALSRLQAGSDYQAKVLWNTKAGQ